MSITFTPTGIHNGPQVNVSNTNAVLLLGLLGLPADPDGECPAEDFLGRVLVAQALQDTVCDDQRGTLSHTEGRVTWVGRRPGYIAERLADLHTLATWAVQHSGQVVWA